MSTTGMSPEVDPGAPAPGRETPTWQQTLRSGGYRLTPQRQLVLEAVTALGHGTPEQILAQVRRTAGGVNITTVYRALDVLESVGLVTHVHLAHGSPTYHTAADTTEHVHFVCRGCGVVLEEPADLVEPVVREASRRQGFVVDVAHLAIFGLCQDCARSVGGDA